MGDRRSNLKYHRCEKQKGSSIVIGSNGDKWLMTVEDHGDAAEVIYCPLCGLELELEEIEEERWKSAVDNAKFMLEEYKKIPTGVYGAITISQTIARYENGERTKELLEELEAIE